MRHWVTVSTFVGFTVMTAIDHEHAGHRDTEFLRVSLNRTGMTDVSDAKCKILTC